MGWIGKSLALEGNNCRRRIMKVLEVSYNCKNMCRVLVVAPTYGCEYYVKHYT